MKFFYTSVCIFFALTMSRFIPHPPNFTSLLALSFYVPVLLGIRYMPMVLISFVITDIIIGFHSVLFFTWGSVILIGLVSKFFNSTLLMRLGGALLGACIFFLVTNFGVWSAGSYSYNLEGFITCYTLALPFFGYSAISTLIFSVVIETIYKLYKLKLKNI